SSTFHCSRAALPREGTAMRSSASWYTCSAMARYSGDTCIHSVACRLSRPTSGRVAAPAIVEAMRAAAVPNKPRTMNPPNSVSLRRRGWSISELASFGERVGGFPVGFEEVERLDAQVSQRIGSWHGFGEQEPLGEAATHVAQDFELVPG